MMLYSLTHALNGSALNRRDKMARDWTLIDLYRTAEANRRQDEALRAEARVQEARLFAARDAAEALGLAEEDAGIFIRGFLGHSIKAVDPRAHGKEHVFRAGRAAALSASGKR